MSQKLRRLESIVERLPLYATSAENANTDSIKDKANTREAQARPSASRTVFVVHGRNDEIKETVARFLGQLDLTPVILHEQPSGGRTVIEKFEDHSDASFAVVLLTPDDVGKPGADASAELQSRARQNVIFEWGFFVAKLGRRHVCALYAEGVELPSDVNGVIYVELDLKGAWKLLLARELKAADVAVDLNRAI
ncbi:MAG: TIR domain-containing protein [Pyrinomonadaceae bacterium]